MQNSQQYSILKSPSTTSPRKPFTPVSRSNQLKTEFTDRSITDKSELKALDSKPPTFSTHVLPAAQEKSLRKNHREMTEVQEKIRAQRNGIHALQAQREREVERERRERELKEKKRREKEKEEKDRDKEDVEMGGIYSLSDKQLGDRWNFEEEIGFGNWGSVWRCQQLQSRHSTNSNSSSSITLPSPVQTVAKLCHRQRSGPSQARVRSLWNEFKVLRGVASSVRAEKRRRNGRTVDDSGDLSVSRDGRGQKENQDWHPNIVKFHEFIISPSYACLFMPYYPQPMNVALPENIYRDYFQGLASGLFWLHSHNCTHNDIKTANILVSPSSSSQYGVPVLVDFGFAVLHSNPDVSGTVNFGAGGGSQVSSKRTQNEDVSKKEAEQKKLRPFHSLQSWGTPEYLAPERARGDVHDERISDAWSLGITFFEIATGRTPFESESEQFLTPEALKVYYERTVNSEWQGTWDSISQELVDLVRGLLEVSPKDRMTLPDAMLSPFFDPLSEKDEGDRSLGRLLGGESSLEREIGEFQHEDEQERGDGRHERDGSISRMSHREQDKVHRSSSLGQVEDVLPSNQRDSSPGWDSLLDAANPGTDSTDTDLMASSSPWKSANTSHSYPQLEGTAVSRTSMDVDISKPNLANAADSSSKPHPFVPRRSSPLKAGIQPSQSYEEDDEEEDNGSIPSELSTPSVVPIEIPQHSSPLKVNDSLSNQKSPPVSETLPPRTPPTKKDTRPLPVGNSPRPRSPTVHGASPIVELSSSSHPGNKTPLRSALRNAAFAAARKLSPSYRLSPNSTHLSPISKTRGAQQGPKTVNQGLEPSPLFPSSPSQRQKSRIEAATAASLAKRFDAPVPAPSPANKSLPKEEKQVDSNISPSSSRKRTARALKDAVQSAERRAASPSAVQIQAAADHQHGSSLFFTRTNSTNSVAPPNYDEVQKPHSTRSGSSQREQSGSESVSIPERNEGQDSMTFDSDEESESDGDRTVDNEEEPTARQTQPQSAGSELGPVYLHPPHSLNQDVELQTQPLQPRRMSSQFGISNPNSKRRDVGKTEVSFLEESPERSGMSGWGVDERRAQELHSPSKTNTHRRTQTAPSISSSIDGAELEQRLHQMAELAKTLTRCVEETRQSFREAGVAYPESQLLQHASLQAHVEQAQALLSTTSQAREPSSKRASRSQRAEHSNETSSSSQLLHSQSGDSLNQSDRRVVFKDQVEQFSPVTTPALSSSHSGEKQQNSFVFPSMAGSQERPLHVPSTAGPQDWTSESNSYGEALQGYVSDSQYESSNPNASEVIVSSQTDVSLPVSAPSLTSASSFEDSQYQYPSTSFASSRYHSRRNTSKKEGAGYISKIPISIERKRKSGAFSYNATPGKRGVETDDDDDVVVISSSRIPASNRSSYLHIKSRDQIQDPVSTKSSPVEGYGSNFSRKLLADGNVERKGKGYTGIPTVAATKDSGPSSMNDHHSSHQSKFSTVGSRSGNGSKIQRFTNLSRSNSSGASFAPKKKTQSDRYQIPASQDSNAILTGKTPATPARGGALWRLLRGVGVKSKEMQRTV